MSNDLRPILVFGATGRQGGSVAQALLRQQWPVRAFVRDADASGALALRGAGAEIIQGSLADPSAIRSAMRDVHGVFSVLPGNFSGDEEVRFGTAIAEAAADRGIAHLVYSSGASVGETSTGVARFDAKPRIEGFIRERGIAATIVRPMIFMEMLVRPGYGLDEDRFTFFLRPDQSMQLVAVDDIGTFVAAIFADQTRFVGQTLKLASDTVTGRDIEDAFSEAAGRPIAYQRFSQDVLAANLDLAHIAASLENGPLAEHVDLATMRALTPTILSLPAWLAASGRESFRAAIAAR